MQSIRPPTPLHGPAGCLRAGWRGAALALLLALPIQARGEEARERAGSIDTEMMFGFLVGTDIGNVGDKEFESETTAGFGKRGGSYGALAQSLALEYIPIE